MPGQSSEHRATKEADRVLHRHRNGVLVGSIPVRGAIDHVYIRANDPGFVANPECFDIGCVLPFTPRNMNPIQNYHR